MSSQSRHVYTRNERMLLEASFARQSHPDIHEKERLAQVLNCNIIQISNWFQNHRRRVKKQNKSMTMNTSPTTHPISMDPPMYPTNYIYHQPTCPFSINNNNNNNSSYYSYPSVQYVYSYEPYNTQTLVYDPYVSYE